MISRLSLLFSITTTPPDRSAAVPHSGGWSESHWRNGTLAADSLDIPVLARARALLLPQQASIIGFRVALYDLTANKLTPRGTSTGKFLYPGSEGVQTGMPQKSLELSGKGLGEPNSNRMVLRGIPDVMVQQGEYTPTSAFSAKITRFTNVLTLQGWGFIGRDLAQATVRVTSIAGGVVTLPAAGVFAVGDYMIFRGVTDIDGNPVSGSYLITAAVDDITFTLQGLPAVTVSVASGTCRKDIVKFLLLSDVTPHRAVVRKIGRPFESYRGRGSKRV